MSQKHKTLTAVAHALGMTQPSLAAWKARFPDAPKSFDADEWKQFIARHELGNSNNRANRGHEDLRRRKLASEVRINELKIAKEERKLIPADDVDAFLLHLGSRVKANLFQLFVGELPPAVAGLPVEEIRIRCEEKADAMCISMQGALEQYRKEQESKAQPTE